MCLLVIFQIVISALFYWRSKRIKQINWLPKFIMILANIEGILWTAYYITKVFFEIEVPTSISILKDILTTITFPAIMGLLIRFQRAQVQLRAQEENTIKILKTIKRASIQEMVFVVTLVVSWVCHIFGNDGSKLFGFSSTAQQSWLIVARISEISFVCIFSFQMHHVNKQLDLFFDQVGIRTYSKKSITALIAGYFCFVINWDITDIVKQYIEVANIYHTLSFFLYLIMYFAIYLAVTVAFYFLADFSFEKRSNWVRPEDHPVQLDTNLNNTKAVTSSEMSLLENSHFDTSPLPTEESQDVDNIAEQVS